MIDSRMIINEQARLIFQTAPASTMTHLVVIAFLYLLVVDIVDTTLLTIWCVALSCIASAKFILSLLYKKKAPDNAKPWLNTFTALTLLVGISWAFFTLFYLSVDDTTYKVIFLAFTCGIIASATAILAPWSPAYYANTIPQLFSTIFVLIYSSEPTSYFLILAFVLFYLMLSSVQRSTNKNIFLSFQLQHKNDELMDTLNSEIMQREQVIKKKTQEAFSEHQRFQALFEGVSAVSVQGYNEDRKVTFWNAASEKIYGYSQEEAIGRRLEDLIIPLNMKNAVIAEHQAWLKEDIEIPSSELTLRHKNGTDIDIFSSHVMITNNDGSKEMFCIDIDIGARKRAEESLLASKLRFQTIFEEAPLGIAVIDSLTGYILNANPAYVQMAGRSVEELRILDWIKTIHPDDVQENLDNMTQMNAGETSGFTMKKRYIQPDGAIRWINMTIAPMHVEDKSKPRHLCLTEDITQNKKIESDLHKSEQVLRVLAESGADNDKNIFQLMVQQLAISQDTRYALIAQIDEKTPNLFNTIAVWSNNTIIDNFSYNLNGTPCNIALNQETCFYPSNIQRLFPEDHLLADMHAEGYLGVSLKDDKGSILGIIALIDDKPMEENSQTLNLLRSLSARASIELERIKSDQKLQLSAKVFSDTHEGITITDSEIIIVDVNPAFSDITGYSRQEVIGKNPRMLSSGKQSPEFYQTMWQQIHEDGHWQGEVWNRKKSGETYAELLTISVVKDDHDNIVNYIGIFTDITNSKKQQEQLNLMAHYDVLTGLPNRALFVDRFTQAIAHSKRTNNQLAICFLDLDNFKPVNDNYGHEVGDKLLIEVAKRIADNIREEDTVSRQGGDEFALLLNDLESFSQCEQTLQRIHLALAQPYIIEGYPHKITASSGITLYPRDDGDIDTLLRHADQAMYQAKLEGKHRYHLFNPEHDQRTIQKHHQLDEIKLALANNEFELYYQPKVNMVTGDVFGAEALIRWIHPEKGRIPPLDFLPAIEGTELEIKIGDWVINQALQQLEIWLSQGIQIEVSVNIASHHLLSDTFYAKLDKALTAYSSVDSQCLQLEILESSALGDLNAISTIIKTCQGVLGIKVALDDFGTGYSSLTHLRSLPINIIKIDQSFVRDMLDDPSDYAIIDGIIGLSDSFNRDVIAEGVETTNHGLMLLLMGCENVQGYGIAKPMPADDFPSWLKDYSPNQEWQHCGNKHRTTKENKVTLFRLIADHWKQNFIKNIQSPPKEIERWPIMNSKHCPCGTWIKRARQDQLFKSERLQQLDKTHEALHFIAHALLLQYQDRNIDAARKGLSEFQAAFDDMAYALKRCE
ncbi:MAG: EAL domain-containing protein [Piscirickettsiaceae bacterium]|nr:EAL domain-containing protein [Piscirickettsiaceae bacterium]